MSWTVEWCNRLEVKKATAKTKQDALNILASLKDDEVTDSRISQDPPRQPNRPNFAVLKAVLKARKLIPFLGSGASLSARAPGAGQPAGGRGFAPSAKELAHHLANHCQLPAWYLQDSQNLSRVASYLHFAFEDAGLEDEDNEPELVQRLVEIFADCGPPGDIHKYLATHADLLPIIVTTNYDRLMEDAFIEKKQCFTKVVHIASDSENAASIHFERYVLKDNEIVAERTEKLLPDDLVGMITPENGPLLYKMHGSVEPVPRTFVITEEHYVQFLSRMNEKEKIIPSALGEVFKRSSFLFLGYSLEDWNFRVIMHSLTKGSRKKKTTEEPPQGGAALAGMFFQDGQGVAKARKHWAIQYKASDLDREIWDNRSVDIFDMDINDFVIDFRKILPP